MLRLTPTALPAQALELGLADSMPVWLPLGQGQAPA